LRRFVLEDNSFKKSLVAQQVRKISVSLRRRPVEKASSLGQQFKLALPQHRLLAGAVIVGLVCVVLVGVGVSAYWGERQRKGLRELEEGVLALQTGDFNQAGSQLALAEQHLQTENNSYLIQLTKLNLGYVAEQQGDLSRARHYYEASAEMDGPAKSEALLAAAHVLTLMKDDTAAVAAYKKFLEQSPESPVIEIVRQKVGDK
jgi:uncharacterized protein HemY